MEVALVCVDRGERLLHPGAYLQAGSLDLFWGIAAGIIVLFALVVVIIAIVTLSQRNLIKAQKERLELLEKAKEQFRSLAGKLQEVREQERTYLAREIHDELGQLLTALHIELTIVAKELSKSGKRGAGATRKLKRIGTSIESAIESVGRIATELRPAVLDRLGLVAAIEWEAREFQKRTSIRTTVNVDREGITMSPEGSTAVFRILQESLTNVARHARAENVTVNFIANGRHHVLEIRDDGVGIPDEKTRDMKSLGILGMKERALLLKGEFDIKGINGKGTSLTLRIPHQ